MPALLRSLAAGLAAAGLTLSLLPFSSLAPVRSANGASSPNGVVAFVDPRAVSPSAFGADVFGTSDGGYVIAGTVGINNHNGWVGKVAASGQLQWQHQFGCGASNLLSVEQTADGGYILAGGMNNGCTPACPGGLSCAWVVKLSSAGNLAWQRFYPGAFQAAADQVRQTSDGGYVVAGSTFDGAATTYAWVAKLDANGAAQWQRQIGAAGTHAFAAAQTVQQTADGGYIVGGSTGVIGNSSALVVKLDASGNVQWQQGYGVGYEEYAKSIAQTADGGYIVAGEDATKVSGGRYDALLMKLDPSGAILWQKHYTGAGRCNVFACYNQGGGSEAHALRPTADGGYVLAGYTDFRLNKIGAMGATGVGSWLVKTDSRGNVVWQTVFVQLNAMTGRPYAGDFYGVGQTSDGGFVAAGYNDKYNTSDNVWVVKTDANGNIPGCRVAHPALVTALNAALIASPLALPASTDSAAGAAATGQALAGGLTAHTVC